MRKENYNESRSEMSRNLSISGCTICVLSNMNAIKISFSMAARWKKWVNNYRAECKRLIKNSAICKQFVCTILCSAMSLLLLFSFSFFLIDLNYSLRKKHRVSWKLFFIILFLAGFCRWSFWIYGWFGLFGEIVTLLIRTPPYLSASPPRRKMI